MLLWRRMQLSGMLALRMHSRKYLDVCNVFISAVACRRFGFILRRFGTFLQKFQFFSKTNVPIFKKKNCSNGKTCCFSLCLHISLVSFHFTSRSTAFESFTRRIFDLVLLNFFIFSNINCSNLRRRF